MARVSVINLNLVELPAAAWCARRRYTRFAWRARVLTWHRNCSLHPSPSFFYQFQGYTLGLLAALALAGATLLFGKHVVAPLGLRGLSPDERALRLARLNRDALARVLLLLYLVYPGACCPRRRRALRNWLTHRFTRRQLGCLWHVFVHHAKERRVVPRR